ncbi:MAG: hypothetical protein U1E65_20875 [Myxococcota bacterium]
MLQALHGLAYAGTAYLAWTTSRRLVRDACAEPSGSVSLALAVALMMGLPVLIARLSGSLLSGVWITGLLLAIAAQLLARRYPRRAQEPTEAPSRTALIIIGVATVLVLIATWNGYIFDEHAGHIPLANAMARGIFPVEHPCYPGEPFPYHYGFAALAAELMVTAGLGVARAIDVVTTVSFAVFLWTAYDLGTRLGDRKTGSMALVFVPLSSGALSFLLYTGYGRLEAHWSLFPAAWSDDWSDAIPPVISNFFQHPQGLGMPLTAAVLMLFASDSQDPLANRRRRAVGALLLGLSSLAQFVYFLVSGLVLGIITLARAGTTRRFREAGLELLLLLGALGLAFLLGGFLVGGTHPPSSLIQWGQPYFTGSAGERLLRHLVMFGLPLLALPLAFTRGPAPWIRLGLLIGAVFGFLMPNIATYSRSWDIVKFYGVGEFCLNYLLADTLVRYLGRIAAPKARAATLALMFVLATFSSWVWLLRYSVFDGNLAPQAFGPPEIDVGEALVEFLGDRLHPHDRVLSTNIDVGRGSGLGTPGVVRGTNTFMVDEQRNTAMADALGRARHHLGAADLAFLGVRFLVFSSGDFSALNADGKAAIADPKRFKELGEFKARNGETRRVWEVLPEGSAP